jgi:hypothetical protein
LTETLGKMNAAKRAAADKVRRKISQGRKEKVANHTTRTKVGTPGQNESGSPSEITFRYRFVNRQHC